MAADGLKHHNTPEIQNGESKINEWNNDCDSPLLSPQKSDYPPVSKNK